MTEKIPKPPYKVRGAVAMGKELTVHLETNPEPGDIEEGSRPITVQEAGRRGGHATLERHGIGFFKKIGAKGGQKTKQLYAQLLSEYGKKGGRPRSPTLDESMGEDGW